MPQLTSARSRYSCRVLRAALCWLASSLACTWAKISSRDERRDRHRDPVLRRPRGMALARPGREQRRLAAAGRHHLGTVGQRPAGIGRVAQDAAHAGRGPARLARRGGHAQIGQPRREPGRWWPGARRYQSNSCAISAASPGSARTAAGAGPVGVQAVPERRPGPRQQRARLQLGLPSAAHPLGDQRPLILRDRAADLQQQLVVRVGAHRPVQELHLAAVAWPARRSAAPDGHSCGPAGPAR